MFSSFNYLLLFFLQDNLEWTSGYTMHFGLIWIDRPSLTRVIKNSLRYYTTVLEAFASTVSRAIKH